MENGDGKKRIVLSFAEGSFYERQATDSKNRTDIEEMIKAYFGRDVAFSLSSAQAESVRSIEKMQQEEQTAIKKSAMEHPAIVKTKQILGADIVDINVEERG